MRCLTAREPQRENQSNENGATLFPLDAREWTVRIRSGENSYVHVFRDLEQADWEAYFCESLSEQPAVFYRRMIRRTEGYRFCAGEALYGWQDLVPDDHREKAVKIWQHQRGCIAPESLIVEADGTSVSFEYCFGFNEAGAFTQFSSILHRFCSPSAEQRARFLCADVGLRAVGELRALISLYDELILSAEGYSLGGEPLRPQDVRGSVNLAHKLFALARLLRPAENKPQIDFTGPPHAVTLGGVGPKLAAFMSRGRTN